MTDKHVVGPHPEGPNGHVRRGISRGRSTSASLLGVGVVLLLVTEALQFFWIQMYAFSKSLWETEARRGEPFTGLDLMPAVLAGDLLLLLIGFVACMTGSPRGTLVGAVCGLAITAMTITAMGITVATGASWLDIGSGIGLGLVLALPGLLLLAYAGAIRRNGGSVTHEVEASANGPSAT